MEKKSLKAIHTEAEGGGGMESVEGPERPGSRFLCVGQRLFIGSDKSPLPRGQAVQVLMIGGGGADGGRRCLVAPLREGGPRRSDWVAEADLCRRPSAG